MSKSSKESTIAVVCSDPRMTLFMSKDENLKLLGLTKGSYSPIANTGSVKFFMDDNNRLSNGFWKELEIFHGHADSVSVVLVNHTDCAWYKSLGQDNIGHYVSDMEKAKLDIINKYPNTTVDMFFVEADKQELVDITKQHAFSIN